MLAPDPLDRVVVAIAMVPGHLHHGRQAGPDVHDRVLTGAPFGQHHGEQPVNRFPADLRNPPPADKRVDMRVEELSVGHLAVRLDRVLTEEFHAEVPDRDRSLVGRAGLGEPEPHMALMLLRDLLCALFAVVGPGALVPTVLVGVHRRVTGPAFPNPFDDVRHVSLAAADEALWLGNRLARAADRALHWTPLLTKDPGLPGLLNVSLTRRIEDQPICGPG
jgi:hypothetical protein